MGLLIDGIWRDEWYDTAAAGGRFMRPPASYRNWVTRDGTAGAVGVAGFAAEPGRYHLYVSLACPWAHRTLIMRALKGLQELVPLSVVHWRMLDRGWTFEGGPGVIPDPVLGAQYLYQIYLAADPSYTGRVTTPVLWDRKTRTIVNNESSEIIRMFNSAFDAVGARHGDYYPADLRDEIDALNARIYETVNDGVYKAGFATTQAAYDGAVGPLFETLDWLDASLARRRYLCGNRVTEADIRLLTTLLRFDLVYFSHFKCNARRIADYPNLHGYARDLYQMPAVAATFDPEHVKRHYYESHRKLNPSGVVPVGPAIDFGGAHDRARLGLPV
ncbi:MAG: glutathione S-transferase family protein [Betaproteobacteria bacterium]|nr:glutathione S-transferase family protein [Betaproteobacteria bacterium]